VVNSPDHTEESIYYRNDDEPITVEGETRYGEVATSEDGPTRIQSYTNADGVIEVSANHAPGIIDNTWHWIRINSPLNTDFNILQTAGLAGGPTGATP
jgi:hypothetical protein